MTDNVDPAEERAASRHPDREWQRLRAIEAAAKALFAPMGTLQQAIDRLHEALWPKEDEE